MSEQKESENEQDNASGDQNAGENIPQDAVEGEKETDDVSAQQAAEDSRTAGRQSPGEASRRTSSGSGSWLALAALVVALGGIAGGYNLWQQLMSVVGPMDQRTAAIEQRMSQVAQHDSGIGERFDQLDSRFKQLDQRTSDLADQLKQLAVRTVTPAQPAEDLAPRISAAVQEAVQSLEKGLNDKIAGQTAAFQQGIKKLRTELSTALASRRRSWAPAEAAYLIGIANDSLQLRRDASTAVAALSAADQRLQRLGDPAFAKTRRLLADEMTALLAVPKVDIGGAAMALSTAEEHLADLPLVKPASPAESGKQTAESSTRAETGWRGYLQGIWQVLKELVTVRRRDVNDQPLMAPAQQRYLTQNIQLKLETARLALLRRDDRTFHASLAQTQAWIRKYYQSGEAAVSDLLRSLETLDKLQLRPELPSVSESLNAIREVMASQATLPKGSTRFQTVGVAPQTNNGGK